MGKRVEILGEMFAALPFDEARFFRTDWFAKRYESQAHANLARLLGDIARAGYATR